MKINPNFQPEHSSPQIHKVPFLQENKKIIIQFILTVLFIGIGIWFVRHQHAELIEVKGTLVAARKLWIILGLFVTLLYITLQGLMYYGSFASLGYRISLFDAIILFLKRNFISIFLPAGGISSLAFFTADLEKKDIPKTQIHFASSIYGFISILSVIVVSIPAFLYALHEGTIGKADWLGLIAVVLLFLSFFSVYRSIIKKGFIYNWLLKVYPSLEVLIDDLHFNKINRKFFTLTLLFSVLIEIVGIAHIYISIMALGLTPSFLAAVMAYLIAVIFLIVSPFLRGLGAIEVSASFLLTRFGYSNVEAISITLLFRFFEFWLPMLFGIFSFLYKLNKILMRIVPAILIFSLGVVNIISVLTPSVNERVKILEDFLLIDVINASNYFVLIIGLFLFVTAAFLLKGLRTTWWFAVILTLLSFIGHLTKAIDYEEATFALVIFLILLATRREYYIKHNRNVRSMGIQTAIISIVSVMVYGIIGFYFLDKKHFNLDFQWIESIRYTFLNLILVGSNDILPADNFARHFLYSINISGCFSLSLLVFVLLRPFIIKIDTSVEESTDARDLVFQYGNSALDYFKTYPDKLFFFYPPGSAFIAYRISGNYAVVLENPVAKDPPSLDQCIASFEQYCKDNSLRIVYYRVDEAALSVYRKIHKKILLIGQEAVVDLNTFTLQGTSHKSLRNSVNKIREKGFCISIHKPPIKDGILQKIKSVSDEWLESTGRKEIVFSQGMFIWEELKQRTIITVENPEEKVIAFLNIVPDYAMGEATYDLIRKTSDAPGGVLDFLLIELFEYLKTENFKSVNLGFSPLSGLDEPSGFPEKSMHFAYEKLKRFAHYRGLREFKEKFNPVWYNKYLIYEDDFDLLQIPIILSKVILP
jgi:phosphatidylglycerol lysyltransferase